MRVLLISSNSGSRGGGEIYLRDLAEGLGSEVHALLAADAMARATHALYRRTIDETVGRGRDAFAG